ncbi:MAG: hypothetical protein IID36_02510 [Planctomycetes bacterium]|nr:hypothetical protein [Planctomycetota bacterium]
MTRARSPIKRVQTKCRAVAVALRAQRTGRARAARASHGIAVEAWNADVMRCLGNKKQKNFQFFFGAEQSDHSAAALPWCNHD